jgi:sulfonate transport system substrate-binding protein
MASFASKIALMMLCVASAVPAASAEEQKAAAPVRIGVLNLAPIAPLLAISEYAAKQGIQVEQVQFQRFADARTALAAGQIDFAPLGPQDISLALSQGITSLVGVAGIARGGDCLVARKDTDIKDWASLKGKTIGVGAGSISWLKFAASVQEAGESYSSLKIVNVAGGGAAYTAALQRKEIDLAVVWQPFCAQAVLDGYGAYPSVDHNDSKAIGGLVAILAANRTFVEKNPATTEKLIGSFVQLATAFKADRSQWARIFSQHAGLPEQVGAASLRNTNLDERLPLESIKRISTYLADNGVITRNVSAELNRYYDYSFLQKATGKSADELGKGQ